MQAVVCQNTNLRVETLPEPVPAEGQVLVDVLRCGICGSDLHMRHHGEHMQQLMGRIGFDADDFPSPADPVVFGHELCCEVLEYGPGCRKRLATGTRVVAPPLLRVGGEVEICGLSKIATGGYAERMLLQESALIAVPNGLSTELAALTEPMAVGWHAVRRSEVTRRDVAIVIGCGPVGLAVIAGLKARGVKTIVASDYSPGRRALAARCGADVVIDPAETSPFASWEEHGFIVDLRVGANLLADTLENLNKLPVPWWYAWRVAELLGAAAPKRPVIFECVGVPGLIQQIVDGAPLMSRVVVVGVCMQVDRFEPALAIQKEIDLRFVFGQSPLEYRDTLQMIANGKLTCEPMLTGVVGLHGVANAFDALGDPETHAKILIDPKRAGAATESPAAVARDGTAGAEVPS